MTHIDNKIIDLLFEYKHKISSKTACIHCIAGLLDDGPFDPEVIGGNGELLAQVGKAYDDFLYHEEKMKKIFMLHYNTLKPIDTYYAVYDLLMLKTWHMSKEQTWKLANYCVDLELKNNEK